MSVVVKAAAVRSRFEDGSRGRSARQFVRAATRSVEVRYRRAVRPQVNDCTCNSTDYFHIIIVTPYIEITIIKMISRESGMVLPTNIIVVMKFNSNIQTQYR